MAQMNQQRGQIIPKGDRKWLVRVYIGRDGGGKRKYHSEVVNGTFKQAESKKNSLLSGLDTQTFVQPSKQTVKDYVQAWLTGKLNIASATRINYEQTLHNDIIPFLGTTRLEQLNPTRIRLFYASLLSERKLSGGSVRITHSVLNQALSAAVVEGLLSRNPCEHVELPAVKRPDRDKFMTPEQTRMMIEGTKGTRYGTLWRVLLTTGLRPQEAFALTWGDMVEQDDSWVLRISRALEVNKGGRYTVGETKTDTSRRVIILSKETAAALLEHKRIEAIRILQAGPAYTRNGFIFSTSTGKFLDHHVVRDAWKRDLARLGLPVKTLYVARHTHLTHLLSAGVNVKAVADRSGHSNATTLLGVYAHVLPAVAKDAADVVERMMETKQA